MAAGTTSMDAKESLKRELREALMDPELYKKFRVSQDHPSRKSHSQLSRSIIRWTSDVEKTMGSMRTRADATKDTDETYFAKQRKPRATATTVTPAFINEMGPVLLNDNVSNNTKIAKTRPTAPLTRKIKLVPIESVNKPPKNPNFVFRPISPVGQIQEAHGTSPEGGLLTFKDLMDRNEHKKYEGVKNKVTAGNCNIYKRILAAAKENRCFSHKMSVVSDVEYPCKLDSNLTYNVRQSLQKSISKFTEGKLREVWMHIANLQLDEMPLDIQEEDNENQSQRDEGECGAFPTTASNSSHLDQASRGICEEKDIGNAGPNNHNNDDITHSQGTTSGLHGTAEDDANHCAGVSSEISAFYLGQPSAVTSKINNKVCEALSNNHVEDIAQYKKKQSIPYAVGKLDAGYYLGISKEVSAYDLEQQPSAVIEPSNTILNAVSDFLWEKEIPVLSSVVNLNADRCAGFPKEVSTYDLEQAPVVVSEPVKPTFDSVSVEHSDNTPCETEAPSGLTTVFKLDADQCAGIFKEVSGYELEQASGIISEPENKTFATISPDHGDDFVQEREVLSGHSTVVQLDADHCAGFSKEVSTYDQEQASAVISEPENKTFVTISPGHDDDSMHEKELPTGLSSVDKLDADQCVDFSEEVSIYNLEQASAITGESESATFATISPGHDDDFLEEKEIPSGLSTVDELDADWCVDFSKEVSAYDLEQASAITGESENTTFVTISMDHNDDLLQEKDIPSSLSTVVKLDADQCAGISKESAYDLEQASAVISESENTTVVALSVDHGDDIREKETLSDLSTVVTLNAERCEGVSEEASAYDLEQALSVISDPSNTSTDAVLNNHVNDITQEKKIPSGLSSGGESDAGWCAGLCQGAATLNLEQHPSAAISGPYNPESCIISNDHGYSNTRLPSGFHNVGKCDEERYLDIEVPAAISLHKTGHLPPFMSEQSVTVFDTFPNNHGDDSTQEQEKPSGLHTIAKYDAESCASAATQKSAHTLDQSSTILTESNETISDVIPDSIGGDFISKQDIPSLSQSACTTDDSNTCVDVPREAHPHDLKRSSAVVGETSNIFDDTPNIHSYVIPENDDVPSGLTCVSDHKSYPDDKEGSPCSKSSSLANHPLKIVNGEDKGDVSTIVLEDSSSDDDIFNEVYQSCLAKGMRPKYISKNYLKNLANACKTAAEVKARKTEPRVKLHKPCRLDTNLTYAVRQSLKRSLPLVAGKNKLSALMMMADGMYDEMSLDRDLDDLAWPFDPLAELRESGLAMVDYMDPHPATSSTVKESDIKDQSSSSQLVPSASELIKDIDDLSSSSSVMNTPDKTVKLEPSLSVNVQKSIAVEDNFSTDVNTDVPTLNRQLTATTPTNDLISPTNSSPEISLGTTMHQRNLLEKIIDRGSDLKNNIQLPDSFQLDISKNKVISMPTAKSEPVVREMKSFEDLRLPVNQSSDMLETISVGSDIQSEDSALGQDSYSTSLDDYDSTSDFSSDIEEVDPSSQDLKQKIQFFSNMSSSFRKPSSTTLVNLKVSVPSKVQHFEKLAQQEVSKKPQKPLGRDGMSGNSDRLSCAGDAKMKIEQFEKMVVPTVPAVKINYNDADSSMVDSSGGKVIVKSRVKIFEHSNGQMTYQKPQISVLKPKIQDARFFEKKVPTIPAVNINHDDADSSMADSSGGKVNVKNRVKMFERSKDQMMFKKPQISMPKPKMHGKLNKSKIAFFEQLATSKI